jgi:hypothetical protein
MDDARIWSFEESLWTGDAAHYRESIDEACVMVMPAPPFALQGMEAVEAVSETPRWQSVELSEGRVARPQEGLIVIAYRARARRAGADGYEAWCTSTYRRVEHDKWLVVQHQQTPPPVAPAQSG